MDEILPPQVDSLASQMRTERETPAIVERADADAALTPQMRAVMNRMRNRRP